MGRQVRMCSFPASYHFDAFSPPISTAGPTESEHKLSEELEQCLFDMGQIETEDEMRKRMDVLRKINQLVKQWVRQTSIEKVRWTLLLPFI